MYNLTVAQWEIVMDIFTAMLEPIPPRLAQRLVEPALWNNWITNWYAWRMAHRESSDDSKDKHVNMALAWWFDRRLDTGYLVMGPNVWFWNDGENIHIVWDNRDRVSGGIPVWDAQVGQFVLPVSAFVAEFVDFSHRFLAELAERVAEAQAYWSPTKYAQELFWLQKEQERRAHSWDGFFRQLGTNRDATNWEQVLTAIATTEKDTEFQRIREQGTHSSTDRDQ